MNLLKKVPVHTLLIAAYPVLALLAKNLTDVEPVDAVRPLVVSIVMAGIIWLLFRAVLKNKKKAALLTSLLFILFYSYGHLYDYLRETPILGINFGHHSYLGALYFALFLLGIWWILKYLRDYKNITLFLNVFSIVLIVIPVAQIAIYSIRNTQLKSNPVQNQALDWNITGEEQQTSNLPDIYYIVPDMYARQDAIMEDMDYDISGFLEELREMGFYVADCSRSNYAQTRLSLTSTLNMNYLDALGIYSEEELDVPLNYSLTRQNLEELGYKIVVFDSGFGRSEVSGVYLDLKPPEPFLLFQPLQPFEGVLIMTSAARIATEVHLGPITEFVNWMSFPYGDHVRTQLFIMDELTRIPASVPGPKFVFAHIMVPHPPYVFAPDGSTITDDSYYGENLGLPSTEELFQQGYRNQVEFMNSRLPDILAAIIAESSTPPVIILQGDHGIRDENRMQILNAYYLGGKEVQEIYPNISPVNTFRIIFNEYFGSEYQLLVDKSFYSEYPERFELELVPETSPACLENGS